MFAHYSGGVTERCQSLDSTPPEHAYLFSVCLRDYLKNRSQSQKEHTTRLKIVVGILHFR